MSQLINYKLKYQRFIESRRHRPLVREKGYEIHHIIPKSIGGTNAKNNLVKLTLKEHLIAHKYLSKMSTGTKKDKMENALARMSGDRKAIGKAVSKLYTKQRKKENSIRMQKLWQDPEWRSKQSDSRKKSWGENYNNRMASFKKMKQSIDKKAVGEKIKKLWADPIWRAKMLEARKSTS